jgi:hypothetical protein
MDYQRCHDRIIERARNRTLEGYSEEHHVIPKCRGGSNDSANLVRLTPEEHYVVHQLLVKIYPDDYNLLWAASNMTGATAKMQGRKNKLYGWLRRRLSEHMAEVKRGTKASPETRAKQRAAKLGKKRDPHTEETKAKMSAASKGKPKSEAHKQASARAKLGKKYGPRPEQWRKNIAEGNRRAASKVDRSWMQSEEYKQQRAQHTREIWEKRRNGELPYPDHHKTKHGRPPNNTSQTELDLF